MPIQYEFRPGSLNLFHSTPLRFLFNFQNGLSYILHKEFIVIIEIETCLHGAQHTVSSPAVRGRGKTSRPTRTKNELNKLSLLFDTWHALQADAKTPAIDGQHQQQLQQLLLQQL